MPVVRSVRTAKPLNVDCKRYARRASTLLRCLCCGTSCSSRFSRTVEYLTRRRLAAGLDSTNAATVVGILAQLAGGGVTVVLSVHQPRPDVLATMRRALILSSTGQVVYSGAPAAAETLCLALRCACCALYMCCE
jgi:hypothetical protein